MSDLGRTDHPHGRKSYRCIWCGQDIPKGEEHAHYTGIWDGDWQDWRMHEECYESLTDDDLSDGFSAYDHERPDAMAAETKRHEGGEPATQKEVRGVPDAKR